MSNDDILQKIINTFAHASASNFLNFLQMNQKGESALLFRLIDCGGEGTPGKLAEELGVSAARIAAMLRSLEIKKLVCRMCDENDRRRVTVQITEPGRRFVEAVTAETERRARIIFDRLGEEDAGEFLRLFNKCTGFAEKLEDTEKNFAKNGENKD